MPGRTSLATSIIAILVEEASTALRALRNPILVNIGVDLDLAYIALELVFVFDRPANDVHIDGLVREAIEFGKHADPLVVLLPQRSLDLLALSKCHSGVTLPTDAVVDFTLTGDDLVKAEVLEFEGVGVSLDLVLPNCVKSLLEVGRRIPGLLRQVALRRGGVGPGVGVVKSKSLGLEGTYRSCGATLNVGVHVTRDGAGESTGDKGGYGKCGLHIERVQLLSALVIQCSKRNDGAGTKEMNNERKDSTEEYNAKRRVKECSLDFVVTSIFIERLTDGATRIALDKAKQ